jgi:hypothetical protein
LFRGLEKKRIRIEEFRTSFIATMDHKARLRWETKKAKTDRDFQERVTQAARRRAAQEVHLALRGYTPPMTEVFPLARHFATRAYIRLYANDDMVPYVVLADNGMMEWHVLNRRGQIVYPEDICVPEEVARRKKRWTETEALRLAFTLARHAQRLEVIREELMVRVHRHQTIQACRYGFKEELMQVVWHPRRVGRILETYGWDVLDNLLGVE